MKGLISKWQKVLPIILLFVFFSNSANAQAVRILQLGDSITRGVMNMTPTANDSGYRGYLARLLDAELGPAGYNFVGTQANGLIFDNDHEGHNSFRTDDILAQIGTYLAAGSPDIVLLQLGTNDISNNETNESTKNELDQILQAIKNNDVNTKIIISSIIPRIGPKNTTTSSMNNLIEDLYRTKRDQGYNIFYAGLNEVINTDPSWATNYFTLPDSVHPNLAGYELLAQVFFDVLMTAINIGSDLTVTDNFERSGPGLGATWDADPEIQIQTGDMVNTAVAGASNWEFMATYRAIRNPTNVSIKWNSTAMDGGLALRLDSPSKDADGYLAWISTADNRIRLWTIVNGAAGTDADFPSQPSSTSLPGSGSIFRVALSKSGDNKTFKFYVDDVLAGEFTDSDPTRGNAAEHYAGVLLKHNSDNDIAEFSIDKSVDVIAPAQITDIQTSVTPTSVNLTWTAPGNDGNTGQASGYDIRYSTSPINNETDYTNAIQFSTPPTPGVAGTSESATISGLQPSTTYYFAIKTYDEVPNISVRSTPVSASTNAGLIFTDTFDGPNLSPAWVASSDFTIVNGELVNSNLIAAWDQNIAVYNGRTNPELVSFTYGLNASAGADFEGAGVVLLDGPTNTANGYMAHFRPSPTSKIQLWKITGGNIAGAVNFVENPGFNDPVAGQEFKILYSSDQNGNYVDFIINGTSYGQIADTTPERIPFGTVLFGGIMALGNHTNNDIDNFSIINTPGTPDNFVLVDGNAQVDTVDNVLQTPLSVQLVDENSNPVANEIVQFSVTAPLGFPGSVTSATAYDRYVNCGGSQYVDGSSNTWEADQAYTQDSWGFVGGGSFETTEPINNTSNDPLYQTEHHSMSSYQFDVPNGTYFVNLKFAEIYANDIGTRIFNVTIEGIVVLDNFDILTQVAKYTKLDQDFYANVSDGQLNIEFAQVGGSDGPKINGICIIEQQNLQVTDASGVASILFRLSTKAGNNSVEASFGSVTPYQFDLTGLADVPAKIVEVSGNGQSGDAGQPLDSAFVVQVTDQYDNPVNGVSTTFAVTVGNGTLSNLQPVSTNVQGNASTLLTLGMESKINSVSATSPGTQPAEIVFSAEGRGFADSLIYISGNNLEGPAGQVLASPFVVKVVDESGNPVNAHPVNWTVIQGNGVIQEQLPTLTAPNGHTQITFQLGTASDTNRVQVNANGFDPVIFTAVANSGVPTQLIAVTNLVLTGAAGSQLPVQVKVADAVGTGMPGYNVTFVATAGGSSVIENQPVTSDANGIAQVNWKLGNSVGVNQLQAQAPALNGSPITFTANSSADVATNMTKVSGDSLTGVVNQILVARQKVKIADQYGNPVIGETVLFTVTKGGGKFLNDQVTQTVNTDSSGFAAAFLILGPIAGQYNNEVKVEKGGLIGSPAIFVASAGASDATKIVSFSGTDQLGFIRQELPLPFVVKVMDSTGNAVAGQIVQFNVQSGGGTINGETASQLAVATDGNGLASITFWPGMVAGQFTNIVHATSSNGQDELTNSPIIFRASAKNLGAKLQLVSGNNQSAKVTSILVNPLVVQILDIGDQPVVNQPVTFEVQSGGAKLENSDLTTVVKQTDSQGYASVTVQLGSTIGQNNNVIHAIADDGFDPLTNSPTVFVASAVASDAVKIQITSVNSQTGVVGQTLTNKLQVSVLDSLGNGVEGHAVMFKVTNGGGNFGGADTLKTINSNVNGIAELDWYLGTEVGVDNNQVSAEANDGINPLDDSPLTFTASANPDVTDPDLSTIEATALPVADGSSVSNVTVTLIDQYSNVIIGKTVTIAVSGTFNTVTPTSVQTDSYGKSVFTLTSIKAEIKVITATNSTDNIPLNSTAQVKFLAGSVVRIVRADGNNQTRNIGTVLQNPLVVRMEDFFSNPVPGIPVFFEVIEAKTGGYLIENQPVLSDSNGEAKAQYVLGTVTGINLIDAKSSSVPDNSVLFSENGEVNSATQLVKISGGDQDGTAGTTLPDPLIVQVVDQKGDPVKDVPVTYSIALGGGQVSQPQPASSDAFGYAATMFTLGSLTGTNIAKAESPGLLNSPISFVANSNFGLAVKVVLVAGDNQNGVVNSIGTPLKVQVLDEFNNAVKGYSVIFNVVSGDVSITNTQPDITDAGGYATATIEFGSVSGNAVIQAQANGLQGSPILFNITILPNPASVIVLGWGDNQRGTVGYELVSTLSVRILDDLGNPVAGDSVTFVITEGAASIVGNETVGSNLAGYAECRIFVVGDIPSNITVLAIAPLLTGSPVTFHATAVQNNFPTLTLGWKEATIEETQATSFNLSGSDPDADPLEFIVANLPNGASLDSVNATTRKFDWTPDYTQSGTYFIRLAVLDGNGGVDRDTVKIIVLNKNRKPVITAFDPPQPTLSVTQGEGKLFTILADDPDQEQIEYFWTKNSVKVALGTNYNYSSNPEFMGTDIVVGWATDGLDSVSHQWTVSVISSVELESFLATPATETVGIELSWVTRTELDNQGFNLYRSKQKNGEYKKINQTFIKPKSSGSYSYLDDQVAAGQAYYYKLEDVSRNGISTKHGPVSVVLSLPKTFALEQNYPNPFNPETTIMFQLPKRVHVYIAIFNVLGQEVKVLIDKVAPAGHHSIKWNGRDNNNDYVTSGIYYYRIQSESFTDLKKMIFLK